jgi:hypothetical protein
MARCFHRTKRWIVPIDQDAQARVRLAGEDGAWAALSSRTGLRSASRAATSQEKGKLQRCQYSMRIAVWQ